MRPEFATFKRLQNKTPIFTHKNIKNRKIRNSSLKMKECIMAMSNSLQVFQTQASIHPAMSGKIQWITFYLILLIVIIKTLAFYFAVTLSNPSLSS